MRYTCSLGLCISRQLSFTNVQFQIKEIPLTQAYIEVYNTSCELWIECKQKFLVALRLLDFDNRKFKVVMALFWAAHQRFFKYLCIASKVTMVTQLECGNYLMFRDVKSEFCFPILLFYIFYTYFLIW